MLDIHNLDNESLIRKIKLNRIKGSIRYSSELLDKDIKKKLNSTHLLVKKVLNNYLDLEAEERVNWWIKFCYNNGFINYVDYHNIMMNEKKELLRSVDLDYYYKVLFSKLL